MANNVNMQQKRKTNKPKTTHHLSVDWNKQVDNCPGDSRSRNSDALAEMDSWAPIADSENPNPDRPDRQSVGSRRESHRIWKSRNTLFFKTVKLQSGAFDDDIAIYMYA